MSDVTISGRVVDYDSGEPVADIVVNVYEFPKWNSFLSEFEPVLSVVSEDDGSFEFRLKSGISIEVASIVSESKKIGAIHRLENITANNNILLKHRSDSIGLIEEPPSILVK